MVCTGNTPSFRTLPLGGIPNFKTQESVQEGPLETWFTMTWEMIKADFCVQYDEGTIPSDFNFGCRFQGGRRPKLYVHNVLVSKDISIIFNP